MLKLKRRQLILFFILTFYIFFAYFHQNVYAEEINVTEEINDNIPQMSSVKKATNLWTKDPLTNKWMYIGNNGYIVRNAWVHDSKGKCYMGEDGFWYTTPGWLYDKSAGKWAYINKSGYASINEWKLDSKGWCYIGSDGFWHTRPGWLYDKSAKKWAYLDKSAHSVKNTLIQDSKGNCYIGNDGFWYTTPGWHYEKSFKKWIYIDKSGYAVKNRWIQDSKGWCYIGNNSFWYTTPGWLYDKSAKKWAHIEKSGYASINTWIRDSKGWCYIESNGFWRTTPGWLYDKSAGKWAYLNAYGYALTDTWKKDSKGWYYINKSGYWQDYASEAGDNVGMAIIGKDGYWTGEYLYKYTIYTHYTSSFEKNLAKQMAIYHPTDYYDGSWINAYEYDVRYFLDPNNFKGSTVKAVKITANETGMLSGINPYSAPNYNMTNIRSLKKNEVYPVMEENNGWYRILTPYRIGWVSGKDITLTTMENNQKFQFLNLSKYSGTSISDLNNFLLNKGILQGYGSSFINASKAYNINEIYLLSHALHETGNGKSHLATGVLVDNSGKLIDKTGRYINSSKQYVDINGKCINENGYLIDAQGNVTNVLGQAPYKANGSFVTVYNMFGIGAYDSDPLMHGAKRAFDEGWTSVDKAITGGAKFIAETYIHHKSYQQNTLYKMRWNPANPNTYATHQYATDIGWAYKQANKIKEYYSKCSDGYTLHFDIPVY